MRKLLILAQAAAITFLAVLGAQGDTGVAAKCPVSAPLADRHCGQ